LSDPADTYSIPGTDVLKNLLGLRDAATLADVERDLVELRDVALKRAPLVGKYDFAHLCAFHRWLFQDIYAWAGKPRTVDITKDQALFCRAALIEAQAPAIFTALEQEPPLSKDPTLAADRLAYHLGEVNALHPFREGNGRAQRAFLWQFALEGGWHVDWTGLDPDENIAASWAAMKGSPGHLAGLLVPLLAPVIDPPSDATG
jgi:cell filamentation protein